MQEDKLYRLNQQDAQKRWRDKHPDYWQNYRKEHSEYTRRNREQQQRRNRVNRGLSAIAEQIAKMDALPGKEIDISGYYGIVTLQDLLIAKMDALAVGCHQFVEAVKERLGVRATYRIIKENSSETACILQEPIAAYNPHFGYEMVDLSIENRLPCISSQPGCALLIRPAGEDNRKRSGRDLTSFHLCGSFNAESKTIRGRCIMSSNTIATVTKMLETLPDHMQDRVAEHLRDYIDEIYDELLWDEQFRSSQEGLAAAAQSAIRKSISS